MPVGNAVALQREVKDRVRKGTVAWGDIVRLVNSERASQSWIVLPAPRRQIALLRVKTDDAGYGIVPLVATQLFSDPIRHYKSVSDFYTTLELDSPLLSKCKTYIYDYVSQRSRCTAKWPRARHRATKPSS